MGFPVRTAPTLALRIAEKKIHDAMAALRQRNVNIDGPCPRCRYDGWNVDLLEIPVNSLMTSAQPMPPNYVHTGATTLSVLSVVCQRCGNTILHNLNVLGITVR